MSFISLSEVKKKYFMSAEGTNEIYRGYSSFWSEYEFYFIE